MFMHHVFAGIRERALQTCSYTVLLSTQQKQRLLCRVIVEFKLAVAVSRTVKSINIYTAINNTNKCINRHYG